MSLIYDLLVFDIDVRGRDIRMSDLNKLPDNVGISVENGKPVGIYNFIGNDIEDTTADAIQRNAPRYFGLVDSASFHSLEIGYIANPNSSNPTKAYVKGPVDEVIKQYKMNDMKKEAIKIEGRFKGGKFSSKII